jgi:hypothetical protein
MLHHVVYASLLHFGVESAVENDLSGCVCVDDRSMLVEGNSGQPQR